MGNTAMQKLISSLYETPKDFQCLGLIIQRAKELLQIEKQQIIKSFEDGNDLGHKGRLPGGEGYYNKLFKE